MKISAQTKSFLILVVLAILGIYICLILWGGIVYQKVGYQSFYDYGKYTADKQAKLPAVQPVDTADWKNYENKNFGFSFKYSPTWKVLSTKKKGDFTILEVDPGAKYFNIKIYVSPKSFYIMDGLPTQLETIGGRQALNVNNALYGVQANNLYYTFDLGWSTKLSEEFNALVHSTQFTN